MINLKIGRNEYEITSNDEFMDNGSCVQLLTQSKERCNWGRQPNPVLSKKAISEINKFEKVQREHSYSSKVKLFSLSDV